MQLKSLTVLLLGAIGLLFSCKEVNPGIVFTVPEKPLLDTTYTTTAIPTPQDKHVLLFDVTGVRCNNCPEAAAIARKIADTLHPGKVSVVALYPTSAASLTLPWEGGFDTLTSSDAEALATKFGAIPNLPIGMVDQISNAGTRFLDRNTWSGHVNNRLALTTPLNIDLETFWNVGTGTGRLDLKVVYTSAIASGNHLLFIGLLENKIVSKQSDKTVKPQGYNETYVHNHALRKLYSSTQGDTLKADLGIGRVFEKHYAIKPYFKWKPENLYCVVWVVDAVTKEVIHVEDIKLKK